MEPTLQRFVWARKRDGRLVPFEADKINRALFAAGEALGRPDPFLARELTDGVLHFLTAETAGELLSTDQIGELVVKVVRELGQPALAAAFEQERQRRTTLAARPGQPERTLQKESPDRPVLTSDTLIQDFGEGCSPVELLRRVAAPRMREYASRQVFSRDLGAAQADRLLTLTGLQAPLELADCVLGLPVTPGTGLIEALEDARTAAASCIAVDGPEYLLGQGHLGDAATLAREVAIGLRLTGCRIVLNLNVSPPPWAETVADGPLFAAHRVPAADRRLPGRADGILDECLSRGEGPLRLDWHLGEHDFAPDARPRLLRLAQRALAGHALAFVFDRPRRPVVLAEGLDRRHAAVLMAVGLHLPNLAAQLAGRKAKSDGVAAVFLQKIGVLCRLALSAATQKREFLRRHAALRPALTRGFLLERARLVIVPVGLGEAVRALTGRDAWGSAPGLDYARQVGLRLQEVLRQDGQTMRLETVVSWRADDALAPEPVWPIAELRKPLADQLRAAAPLHALGELGDIVVQPPGVSVEEFAELLHAVWRQTEVVRLRVQRTSPPPVPALWKGSD